VNCCEHHQGLNQIFDDKNAEDEARAYTRRGLDKHARAMAEAAGPLAGAAVLEVGGGIGGLHLELLKHGAASAVDVDASAAYLRAAQGLAARLGLADRVRYQQGDFASLGTEIPTADVVVMHRVVCCYPQMRPLVTAAADHARCRLVLSHPVDTWYARLAVGVGNAYLRLSGSGFRVFVHAQEAIVAAAEGSGLRLTRRQTSWPWQIAVFERV
jgi:magnesium-protoporphyrin O-methyltransferase